MKIKELLANDNLYVVSDGNACVGNGDNLIVFIGETAATAFMAEQSLASGFKPRHVDSDELQNLAESFDGIVVVK